MAKIESIHFVGGLGAHQGLDLRSSDVLAIKLAQQWHKRAEVFLHTAIGSWSNYKAEVPYARRVTHEPSSYGSWPNWQVQGGVNMADRLRLKVLSSCQASNALYLDTDAYCVRSLNNLGNIEGCAMARLGPFMIANGLIYVGKDKSFLSAWLRKIDATKAPPASFGDYACRMPHELAKLVPGLTVLDCREYHGVSGDEAMRGYWASCNRSNQELLEVIANSSVVHLQAPAKYEDKLQYENCNSAYQKMLKLLEQTLHG